MSEEGYQDQFNSYNLHSGIKSGALPVPKELKKEIEKLFLMVSYDPSKGWSGASVFTIIDIVQDLIKEHLKIAAKAGERKKVEHEQELWIACVNIRCALRKLLMLD